MNYKEKLENLSERTELDETLLRQLPEDRITHFFNESSDTASLFSRNLAAAAFAMCAFATPLNIISGNWPLAVVTGGLTLLNFGNMIKNENGIKTNERIASDIQTELAEKFAQTNSAAQPPEEIPDVPAGPINGPIRDMRL